MTFLACSLLLWAADPLTSLPEVDAICCGAACCLIDGACHSQGDVNPMDACLVCDPSTNQTDWSESDDPSCSAGSETGSGGSGSESSSSTTDGTGGGESGGDEGGAGCRVAGAPFGSGLLSIAGLVLFANRRRR